MLRIFIFLLIVFHTPSSHALVVRSIRDFGAKGNGVTNDQAAFEKAAAFIQQNGGNVKLILPKGIYLVGKQTRSKSTSRYMIENNVFSLHDVSNVQICGIGKVLIRYVGNLRFGTFNPITNEPLKGVSYPFYDGSKTAQIGCLFQFQRCNQVLLSDLEADGNNTNVVLGGGFGDTGIQLWHYGVHATDCTNLTVKNLYLHHFCLDGMLVNNSQSINTHNQILNCRFHYNARQGLSWVAGNGLQVQNCSFNFSGQARFSSSPASGLDIEGESATGISNGVFTNCQFIHNKGCGLLANSGNSRNMQFTGCTFWGIDNWSAWVEKPGYKFTKCNFFGSFVHGYLTSLIEEATQFKQCLFKDSSYMGKPVYGQYLLECDSRKLMIFDSCQFMALNKKLLWYNGVSSDKKEDKPVFRNCVLLHDGKSEVYNANTGLLPNAK
ncbi:MAG TPA: right-handed parallel beta-helix repeat-containing protein [Chitinophagaceae bacterium]|nr:right-handed parallel beta-helix repeat-containing protein [Chitinophagaceae bacterium]